MLQKTSDGGYLLGGTSSSFISGDKTQASRGGSDIWLVKLSSGVTGIKETEPDFKILILPNPNQGKFSLKLSELKEPSVEVTVSDLLGRRVLHNFYKATNNQFSGEINLPDTSGMYLLQIKSGTKIITRKIIID
jgi:hypothetical protein